MQNQSPYIKVDDGQSSPRLIRYLKQQEYISAGGCSRDHESNMNVLDKIKKHKKNELILSIRKRHFKLLENKI